MLTPGSLELRAGARNLGVVRYLILARRTGSARDARLYPALSCPGGVALEPSDGEPLRIRGSAMKVLEGTPETLGTVFDIRRGTPELLITDSRFVVSYPDDHGWRFGRGVARIPVVDEVDATAGASRADRRYVVGHIRYPWLRCAGYRLITTRTSCEVLRVGVTVRAEDGAPRWLFLDVSLPARIDSAAVARAIVRRATAFRLRHIGAPEREHARLASLADTSLAPTSEPGRFVVYELTRYSLVDARSAYPQVSTVPFYTC